MKGNPAVPGGPSTSRPTWSNTFRVFHRVGLFLLAVTPGGLCHQDRNLGYRPSGGLGLPVVIALVLLVVGYIPRGF